MAMSDLRGPERFDAEGDATTVSVRWKAWLEEFEAFADCKGLFNNSGGANKAMRTQRRSLLLYLAGPNVRQAFNNIPDNGENDDYEKAMTKLNAHYTVTPNKTFLRHVFRKEIQKQSETIAQFVSRLRTMSDGCAYADVDTEIVDQVIGNCLSENLRHKLLSKGSDLTLAKLMEISASFEALEIQTREMKVNTPLVANRVNKAKNSKPKQFVTKPDNHMKDIECFRCGKKGHVASDRNCPARGKKCHKCNVEGHFSSKCKTKSQEKHYSGPKRTANCVKESKAHDADSEHYAFSCVEQNGLFRVKLIVGNVPATFVIDSGCDCNIVGRGLWAEMKAKGIECRSRKVSRNIVAYASKEPLQTLGVFNASVGLDGHEIDAEFVVVDYDAEALLGHRTSCDLGLLKIGKDVNLVESKYDYSDLCDEYKELFSGVGKLKDKEIELMINPDVRPVCQPYRRVPFGLRSKVERKLDELIKLDIIEKVDKPSQWASPIVIVPKPNGDIRICVDMRQANEAIVREPHPIPTVDEMLLDMAESKIFSKLDLKWGFHQLMLHENSREVTTFITHTGMFRYKRLLFGVNAAPEIYQNEIRKIVQGIPGVANMSDDLIIHGASKMEHDQKLKDVFERLSAHGLTLNKDKCVIGVNKVEFLGHKLSDRGVDPGAGKVEAVLDFQAPRSVSEIRSFMGLVNYLGRFIPNLAELSEPLRNLTRHTVPFKFGIKEKHAFEKLKAALASHDTLGFFDLESQTKVIADAGPVGLGAVLIQIQNGAPRVISYANRSLTDVERRYSQTEKESLALVWACERFQSYLIGIRFDLLTDHRPLLGIYSRRSKPSARIERWVLRLQPFDFNVVYIRGKYNIADPLSRLLRDVVQAPVTKTQLEGQAFVRFVAENATPGAMTTKMIERASHDDPELKAVRHCLEYGDWSNFQGPKIYRTLREEFCIIGQLVLRGNRLVIPSSLRGKVLALAHEGHLGIVNTKQNLRTKVWWPGVDAEAEKHCKSCHSCQTVSRTPNPEPIKVSKLPERPWEALAIDFHGPLPSGEHILVVVDYFSRFYEIAYMRGTTARQTIHELDKIFFTHGLPSSIRSDNGPQFISQEFKAYCEHMGIEHRRVTPRWPQANGEVERQNASLVKRIKIAYGESRDYKLEIRKYMTSYRSIPHPSTGKSPAELLYGRRIRTKMPFYTSSQCDLEVRDKDEEYKARAKDYVDESRSAITPDIRSGDVVLLRRENPTKTDTTFYPDPVRVVDKCGSKVTIEAKDGRRYERNTSHLKPYRQPILPVVDSATKEDTRTDANDTTPKLSERPVRSRKIPEKLDDYILDMD